VYLNFIPRVLAVLEPWAEISQRLRRIFKLNQYVNARGRAGLHAKNATIPQAYDCPLEKVAVVAVKRNAHRA